MSPALSRIEIESAGSDPRQLARALLAQLPAITGPVAIEAIAEALDIVSIEVVRLSGIKGCLQCDPLKSKGQIVVNALTRTTAARRQTPQAGCLIHA